MVVCNLGFGIEFFILGVEGLGVFWEGRRVFFFETLRFDSFFFVLGYVFFVI